MTNQTENQGEKKMTTAEVKAAVADRAKNGRTRTTIMATDKDGHKYEVRVIAMPDISEGDINGTAAVIIDGQHYNDMTFAQVVPIFDHMVSVSI